ncbi:MAG: hypothetical protein Q4C63_04180 [Eubacteriales bacterium]|nr:hypothetical protein [Eubacteriales bacterium]
MLFKKKETVFERKDRALWELAKTALKEAGMKSVRAGFSEDEPPVCGCGSKLDPRNFGPRGKIDRNTYYIRVPEEEAVKAREILRRAGVETELESTEADQRRERRIRLY